MTATSEQQTSGLLVKVVGFSLALTLVFTLVANTLPQIEGEAPVDEEIDLGALTLESFIALGESIFSGKGTCTLCHNNLGRAPDLLASNIAQTATERLADERYQGQANDVESYLRESLLDPSAYVVAGFGQKGSNDTVSPMPAVNKAPILLSDAEIDAVIAYMQAKDGNEVTVALPSEAPTVPDAQSTAEPGLATAPKTVASAEEVANKYACTACHSMLGAESPVGPSLNDVGTRLSVEDIRQSIIDPNAVIAAGFSANMMPPDFAERMTIRELELIVHFLAEQTEQ